MEALHVVVLPASEATATSGGTPRSRHRGAPIGGRLLAGVREALAKAAQVLPVTILTIGEVRLGCWGFAHIWGGLRRRWWEGQRGSPWGGRWRRDPWRGELIRGWGWRTVAKTELWWSAIALWEALWWGEASRRRRYNVGSEGWGRGRGSSARRGWAIATNGLSCWHPHSLWAISLLPRWRGLARPAIGCTGRHSAAPLAGSWLSWCLVFAVPRFSPFNLHLNKPSAL